MVLVWLWTDFYPLAVSIPSFVFLRRWYSRFHTSWMGWTLESFFRFLMYFPSYQRRTCFSCSLSCFANEYVTNENTDNTIIAGMNANAEREWCMIIDEPYSNKIVDSFIKCVFVSLRHLLKMNVKNICTEKWPNILLKSYVANIAKLIRRWIFLGPFCPPFYS